ncbi:siphovirus Gp157 family protein [Bacilliculturomica massiliensis]|uniref:siphovirus Gp157 family protein n=1 Tax=Bacilliculturomica massiliensis TaxID=1917867 RepID=UPI001030DCF8|nr:siphovirus Gp157 family protein [Bacilliculturomica massiliensis]
MNKLYEIDEAIMECLDLETGEILDEERLNALQMERDKKIENVALWIKNLKADAEAYKAEKDSFAERQRAAENKVESLKDWLVYALNGNKFSTTKVAVSYRKSESVSVVNAAVVPEDFLTYAEPTVNKTLVKAAIKAGNEIPGCELIEKQNVQIK